MESWKTENTFYRRLARWMSKKKCQPSNHRATRKDSPVVTEFSNVDFQFHFCCGILGSKLKWGKGNIKTTVLVTTFSGLVVHVGIGAADK